MQFHCIDGGCLRKTGLSLIREPAKFQEDKSGVKTTGFLFSPPKESKNGVIYAPTGPGLCMDVATLNGLLRKALQV
ncbi:hypothetical protein ACFPES_20640 [Paenibacillus sp. GCM10023248]|uniref:hypothetical protein n=1 Tax=unclassified Paenibacillus TaxID=185978 RepID=UPI00237871A4|nr:hypothetical protein [Paenibacillus sp. MAHUQ-63]MDD9269463.1 hypothetical protein [Paenibacillus sp. MAHUQ-63]